jgi:hypothetical protein
LGSSLFLGRVAEERSDFSSHSGRIFGAFTRNKVDGQVVGEEANGPDTQCGRRVREELF